MPLLLVFLGAGLVGLLGFLYWLIVIGEGTYLGPRAVRMIYHYGAAFYDEVRSFPSPDDETILLPLLLGSTLLPPDALVLDVATGTGRVPLLLAQSSAFTGSVVGMDMTPAMVHRAVAKQRQHTAPLAVSWQIGEASRLNWATASFDLVTCLEALEFMPRPRQALREMTRVLHPGGTLVVSKFPDLWAWVLPGKAFTQRAMVCYLTELGFTDVTIYPWQPGHYELVVARQRRV